MHIETICRVDVQLDAKMCRRVSTEKNKQIRVIQISRYKYNNNNNNNKRACTGFEPMTSALPVSTETNWANKPTVFHIFLTVYSSLHGFICNQHHDQLPVGLLAHLVERCTGIAEVMGSNPVQAWIFFRPCFHHCPSSAHYCADHFHSNSNKATWNRNEFIVRAIDEGLT